MAEASAAPPAMVAAVVGDDQDRKAIRDLAQHNHEAARQCLPAYGPLVKPASILSPLAVARFVVHRMIHHRSHPDWTCKDPWSERTPMSTAMSEAEPKPKPLCFVIGPIGSEGTEVRKLADFLLGALVRPVLEGDEFNYKVKRADEDADPGMITDKVIADILNAELVVADLTGLNPNTFWELGIRHSALKPVIHIAVAGTKLPFDNFGHRAIFVDTSDWQSILHNRQRLADAARLIRGDGYQVSNPITQARARVQMRASSDPIEMVISDLQDQIATLTRAVERLSTPKGSDTVAIVGLDRSVRSALEGATLGWEPMYSRSSSAGTAIASVTSGDQGLGGSGTLPGPRDPA